MRYNDHPKGLLARLPADEIEDLVRKAITEHFLDHRKAAAAFNIDPVEHHGTVNYITDHDNEIDIDALIRSACKKVLLSQESLRVIINCKALAAVLAEQLNLTFPQIHADITYEISTPYYITRSSKGAFRIDGAHEALAKDDPFNRAEHEVQNWMRGIVWRDLYFRGKSLDDIAGQEAVDVRYVSRLIDESLSII